MKEFTVLLVEGSASVADQLRSLFQQTPYQLELSDNRDVALRQLSVLKPHVLLLGSLEPGDDVALGAAAEIAGIPTLSATKEPERLLERLRAILEPHAKRAKPEVDASALAPGRLDDLAVALADEISDQGEALDLSAKPGEPRSGSDGVTQILGLLEMNKEDDGGVSRMGKLYDGHSHSELKLGPSPADSSGELSASLFALAVGTGKEGPIVTRVAKPHLEAPPKEEAPLESAIFTPPEALREPPKPEKTPKTKSQGVSDPEPPRKAEAAPKPAKEETRRIFTPNIKEATKPRVDPIDEILSFSERRTPLKREAPPTRNQTPVAVVAPPQPTPIATPLTAPPPTPPPAQLPAPPPAPVYQPTSQLSGLPLSPTPWSQEPQVVRNARLLHEILLQRSRGVITSKAGTFVRTLSVSGGVVLQATSNVPEEQFAFILYREGKLTRAQLDEIRLMGESSSEEVAKTIYKKGFARRAELESARKRHREEVFAGLLEGACDFQAREVGLPAPQEKTFAATLVAALRRRLSTQEARGLLEDATLNHSACPVCSREQLGLSPQESMLLQRINGQAKLAELMGGVSPDLALPLLVALEIAGLVQIAAREPKEDESQQELMIERGRIEGKHEEIILADYFTLLGVSRRATRYEIEQAHQALSQAFHPDRFQSPQYADLLPHLAEIQEVLSDALFVLSDEATRSSYAQHLVE